MDSMLWQILIDVGASLVLAVVGWYVKIVRADLIEAEQRILSMSGDITTLRVKVAEDYITHVEMRDVKDTLIRIEAKLDLKQDKGGH